MSKWHWNTFKNRKCGKPQNRSGNQFNKCVVLHTTENTLGGKAENVALWQNTQKKVYSGYHYLTDSYGNIFYQCNPDNTKAYHAGRSYNWGLALGGGNNHIGVSMVAYAGHMPYPNQKDMFEDLLDTTAKLMLEIHLKYGIPMKRITIEEYRAGQQGWLGHQDVAYRRNKLGKKVQRKFDPGKNFPWDRLIEKANALKEKQGTPIESKVIKMDSILTTADEMFLRDMVKELQEAKASPSSLKYTLRFYRELAKQFGFSGAQPEVVAKELFERVGGTP